MNAVRAAWSLLATALLLTLLRRRRAALRFSRVVPDLDRAVAFYRDALGFVVTGQRPLDAGLLAALGLGNTTAREATLRLGAEQISLVQFARPGRAYPADSRSDDLWFQHLAIVVADMDAAYTHLRAVRGWRPISEAPQTLPPANGSVRAFKFRDPDGHPLELIWFPPGQGRSVWQGRPAGALFLGIDHSALAVAATRRSLHFYRKLGFRVSARSLNSGPAQARLDQLPAARVRVTGLRPGAARGPGLELLAYRPPGRLAEVAEPRDQVTDWVTLGAGRLPRALRDPDGHLVLVMAPAFRPSARSHSSTPAGA